MRVFAITRLITRRPFRFSSQRLSTHSIVLPERRHFFARTVTMAAITLDDNVKSLISKSYPQAAEAGDDTHKLSAAVFSNVEVSMLLGLEHCLNHDSTPAQRKLRPTNGSSHPRTLLLQRKMRQRQQSVLEV